MDRSSLSTVRQASLSSKRLDVNEVRVFAPERFDFLTQAAWAIEAVEAAQELGVLQRLEGEPVAAAELASDCGLNPRHSHLLLSALVGLGVAEASEAGYRLTFPGLAKLLPRLLPAGRLVSVLNGAAPKYAADTPSGSQQLYPGFVRLLAGVFRTAAETAAGVLGGDDLQVLDVGAGAAPWSLAVVARHAGVHVVAVDLPGVIEVTTGAVDDAGLRGHYDFRCGDIFELDFDLETFDLVIAGGLCHLFDKETCAVLIDRLAALLRPGGTLAIIEPLPDEPLDGSLPITLYSLGLLTRTAVGGVHPFSTYAGWLRSSGLRGVKRSELSSAPPLSLITGHRDPAVRPGLG